MVYKYAQFNDFMRSAHEKLVEFCNQREDVGNFEIIDIIKFGDNGLMLFYKEDKNEN